MIFLMNIVIFSPVVEFSAIGMMNHLLVQALLKQKHAVVVVRTEYEDYKHLPSQVTACDVLPWQETEKILEATAAADINIYQIGDNYSLHAGCVAWLPKVSGIVCLHDYYLANLFNGFAQFIERDQAEKIIDSLYGKSASTIFFSTISSSEEFIKQTHKKTPMVEWIAQMALGVIVHSTWDIQRVIKFCPGPVYFQELPNIKPIQGIKNIFEEAAKNTSSVNYFTANRIVHVLTIGNANENKRIKSIIQAISQSSYSHKIHYHIAGSITDNQRMYLQSLANSLNVNISLWGSVSDEVLENIIQQSDIITCLRWPALESASASLIEALLHKRPTIVTDTGFYSELPDHVVFKIDPHNEIAELVVLLNTLVDKIHQDTKALGEHVENAYQWASKKFCIEKYANTVIEVGNKIQNQQSITKITHSFAEIINQWNTKGISQLSLPNLEIFCHQNA